MAYRRRSMVELFNFSFLDILACVIGLLIFILTIVVITGSQSPAMRRRVTKADSRRLRAAHEAVAFARARVRAAQRILRQRAVIARSPAMAQKLVNLQIASAFARQAASLRAARHADAKALAAADERVTQGEAAAAAERRKIASLKRRTLAVALRAKNLKAKPSKTVSFYVPRVHHTSRTQVWVQIAGRRCWVLNHHNCHETHMFGTTLYTRKSSTKGRLVATLVTPGAALPTALARNPRGIVLDIGVRPDAYASFRQLRSWAWKKGFAVEWYPLPWGRHIALKHRFGIRPTAQ